MAWDPALLRKYNTTGHFRLLNQVRSELKDKPLQRTTRSTSARNASAGSRPQAPSTTAPQREPRSEPRAEARGLGVTRRRSSSFTPVDFPVVPLLIDPLLDQHGFEPAMDDDSDTTSFRDRLGAVDMR
jgi:hypothetical protein